MSLIVDASVFVAATRAEEEKYTVSRHFLLQAVATGHSLWVPSLVIPECACAVVRHTGEEKQAGRIVQILKRFSAIRIQPLSVELAETAAALGSQCRLRGSDACYAALSAELGGTLVTWDLEMLDRTRGAVSSTTPERWLEERATHT